MLETILEEPRALIDNQTTLQNNNFEKVKWKNVALPVQSVNYCTFKECVFEGIQFPSILKCLFTDCIFKNCTWGTVSITLVEFVKCAFIGCELHHTTMQSCCLKICTCEWRLLNCTIAASKVCDSSLNVLGQHTQFKSGEFDRTAFTSTTSFNTCVFDSIRFIQTTLIGRMHRTMFTQCQFQQCRILAKSVIMNCRLAYCTVVKSYLLDACFESVAIIHSTFESTQIVRCGFKNARFEHVNFKLGSFSYNNLSKAQLYNIKFDLCDTKTNIKTDTVFSNISHVFKTSTVVKATFKKDFKHRSSYTYELIARYPNGDKITTIEMTVLGTCDAQDSIAFCLPIKVLRSAAILQVTKISNSAFALFTPYFVSHPQSGMMYIELNDKTHLEELVKLGDGNYVGFAMRDANSMVRMERANSV